MKRIVGAFVVTFVIVFGLGQIAIARSHADYTPGCETIHWGFLGMQRRGICDGPRQPDGSWFRARAVWTPAHHVPITCYGYSFITCNGGYDVDTVVQSKDGYIVTDATVLPDEPGWLPSGTDRII